MTELAPDHLSSDATTTIAGPALVAALAHAAAPPCDGPALAADGMQLAERLGDPLAVALGACLLRRALHQDHGVRAAPSPDTLHRLLLAATTVAMKAHFDDFYVNKYMARIGGLEAPRELAELEAHLFVTLLGGHAQVSAEELRAFLCVTAAAPAPSVVPDPLSARPPLSATPDEADDAFRADDASVSGTLPSIATHPGGQDSVSCDIDDVGGDSDGTVAAPTRVRKGTARRRRRRRAGQGGVSVPRAPPTLPTLRGINADPSAEIDAVNDAPFTGSQSPGTDPTHPIPTATQPTTTTRTMTTTPAAAATASAAVVHYHYHFHVHHVVYVPAALAPPAPPPAATAGGGDC